MTEKLFAEIMLVIVVLVVVCAVGSNIILIETNYVYAQWITPTDLSGINQNMHQKTSRTTNNKIVMINFDDAWESQYLYAKPILDKYGFKASFFIPCAHVSVPGHDPPYMTWSEVADLTKDTMDIESHTMTHAHLTELNDAAQLNYEIVTAKDCFAQHGITTNWFGYPLNLGQDNKKIVSVVASVYPFARSGDEPLFFLNCNGYKDQPKPQPNNCYPLDDRGDLTFANRYNVKTKSFYHILGNGTINYDEDQMFLRFQARLKDETNANADGQLHAIPIFTYHKLGDLALYNTDASAITVREFAREMDFLHNNGYRTATLADLRYNTNTQSFYLP